MMTVLPPKGVKPMVAANADDYAVARQNIFFPANNETNADGNLTGQCVTLVKWFFAEMCDGFPRPFAARGDARYVGKNLVAQGLADEVPYAQRRRGDIICLEYGTYGHIYVELGGGRVFEENVNIGGVARRVVDGAYVYASRIGSDSESWRGADNPHAYRLKSYKEGGTMAKFTKEQEQTAALMATGSIPGDQYNYPFTVQDISSDTLNEFLQTWQGRMSVVTPEIEQTLAKIATGSTYGKDYNSQFQGKPIVQVLIPMLQFWLGQRSVPTAKPLPAGIYEVK
jgi:hypothetical protein